MSEGTLLWRREFQATTGSNSQPENVSFVHRVFCFDVGTYTPRAFRVRFDSYSLWGTNFGPHTHRDNPEAAFWLGPILTVSDRGGEIGSRTSREDLLKTAPSSLDEALREIFEDETVERLFFSEKKDGAESLYVPWVLLHSEFAPGLFNYRVAALLPDIKQVMEGSVPAAG